MATKQAKVLFDFTSTQDGQLTVKQGDIVDVLPAEKDRHAGWIKISLHGCKGYVPAIYTKPYTSPEGGGGTAQQSGTFGVSLRALMSRPTETGSVPSIVLEIIGRLTELDAARCDGIFRWPGAEAACASIMRRYNAGQRGPAVTAVSSNAADWATVLQRWNRMLPEKQKLVPWASGSPEMQQVCRLGAAAASEVAGDELLAVVARLPEYHRQTFEAQLEFVRTIDHKQSNMGSLALAKMLAPDWFGDVFANELEQQTRFIQKLIARGRAEEPPTPLQSRGGAPRTFGQVRPNAPAAAKRGGAGGGLFGGCCGSRPDR
eukprot:COSAG05_NODE_2658_length_2794_cov_3.777737_2_plen_317_part_00